MKNCIFQMPLMKHIFAVTVLTAATASLAAEQLTFTTRTLTPEAALTAAKAAMESCRKSGYQVAVAVVDRHGLPHVTLRDRFAGAHTIDTATGKAWTAASFKQSTTQFATHTAPSQPMSGIRQLPRVAAIGGGLTIEAAGNLLGAIAVSGAPGGDADATCANAGIKAIADEIEF